MRDAIEALAAVVEDVEWARNSGDGKPDLTLIDSLVDAANAVIGEHHRSVQEAEQHG
jgi:hypothetical protein